MGSRREEERNEKIIRGLLKLPPNRKCINCNSLGPQYVCTNFWTFVCIACSGIHREFTHRVKSVSMAKFTSQEVEALEKGGNQRAREIFLKDWDMQRQRLPESSNVEKVREFIKSVYVDKKYSGGKSSDKPPRDLQGYKNHEEERRASSYHSYSQSPPYDYQYEDRRYGKQAGMLTRKPGSDRVQYDGKFSGLVYSPGRGTEDRFANEGSAPRLSDYSVSSAGEASRHGGQSPNFGKEIGDSSPPGVQVRNILIEDGRRQTLNTFLEADTKGDPGDLARPPRSRRPVSSESFGSLDCDSPSRRSVRSGSLVDASENNKATATLPPASLPSTQQISPATVPTGQDLFGLSSSNDQQPANSSPSIDLFAEVKNPMPSASSLGQKPIATPASSFDLLAGVYNPSLPASMSDQSFGTTPSIQNVGWATFDIPQNLVSNSAGWQTAPLSVQSSGDQNVSFGAISSVNNNLQWASEQSSSAQPESIKLVPDPWTAASHPSYTAPAPFNFQSWNAFDDTLDKTTHDTFRNSFLDSNSQIPVHMPSSADSSFRFSEDHDKNSFPGFPRGVISGHTDDSSACIPAFPLPSFPGEVYQQRKSTNPFDFPCETESTGSSGILDMSSLQASLPNAQLPSPLSNSAHWFPQFSVPPGGIPYMTTSNSQIPNLPSQGPVASLGGNPFA